MAATAPIRFGTGGWRGLLGSEVTGERLLAVLRGSAAWLARHARGRPVVLGYDGRAAGPAMASIARAVLHEAGLSALESAGPSPTPAP